MMRNISQTLKYIRPSLREVAPLTFYTSWGFGIFNIAVSIPLYRINEANFLIVGVVNLKIWAIIFMIIGLGFAYSLISNNWKLTRNLLVIGVAVKGAWLMELVARSVNGKSFILTAIWALLLYLQFITFIYFAPVEMRNDR